MKPRKGNAIYFREFDINKYREMEPLFKRIEDRTATNEEAISLLDCAIEIMKSEDFFIKNTQPDGQHDRYDDNLKIITTDRKAINELGFIVYKSDKFMLSLLVEILVFPQCQFGMSMPPESKTTLAAKESYWNVKEYNRELFDLLNNPDGETFSYDNEGSVSIYSINALKKIERLAKIEGDKRSTRPRYRDVLYYEWHQKLCDLASLALAHNNTIVMDVY